MIDHRLHTFLTVCKYMNYTKAAQELFITQPAVSQHIRYLEKYYGVSLFSYSGKILTLTPAGRLLLQKASAMKNDEILLKQSLLTADTGTFSYHFGVTTTIVDIGEISPGQSKNRYSDDHGQHRRTSGGSAARRLPFCSGGRLFSPG